MRYNVVTVNMTDNSSFASVLQNRGFLNLWVNQVLVQLSFNSLNFALIVWVFQLTNSSFATSALLLCISLPAVFFGLFSGVLVDVIDKKKIIMFTDLLLSLSFFSLIFVKDSYFAVLGVAFFVNALGQFYTPAEASAIPLVVKKHQLVSANSIFSATLYSCFLLGFGVSGPLINYLGLNFVFGLGAMFLAVAFVLSLTFPRIVATPDKEGERLIVALKRRNFLEIRNIGILEIIKTIRLIRGKLPVLVSIFILAGVQVVIGVLAVLMPGFLEKASLIKATDASYILIIPLGLGIVIGGLILAKVGQGLIRRKLVSKAIIFGGLMFFLIGIAPIISPAIKYFKTPTPLPFFYQPPLSKVLVVGSFLLGLCLVSILVPSQTVLQENTPKEDRGKVFSVLGVAMAAFSIAPVLLAGILADIFGVTPIFVALGVTILLIGLFGLKPNIFFKKEALPAKVREFLGVGHWENK